MNGDSVSSVTLTSAGYAETATYASPGPDYAFMASARHVQKCCPAQVGWEERLTAVGDLGFCQGKGRLLVKQRTMKS